MSKGIQYFSEEQIQEMIEDLAGYFVNKIIEHIQSQVKNDCELYKSYWEDLLNQITSEILSKDISKISFPDSSSNGYFISVHTKILARSLAFFLKCETLWDEKVTYLRDIEIQKDKRIRQLKENYQITIANLERNALNADLTLPQIIGIFDET